MGYGYEISLIMVSAETYNKTIFFVIVFLFSV